VVTNSKNHPESKPRSASARLGLLFVGLLLAVACEPDLSVPVTNSVVPPGITVTVGSASPGRALNTDQIGLSFEVSDLASPVLDPATSNLSQLLKSLGRGHLRFGGDSVDRDVAWVPAGTTKPAWAQRVVTATDLDRLARLSRASGWSVDLTVGLGHLDPARAADFVVAARDRLGSSLQSVQIGNEPDHFPSSGVRPSTYDYVAYHREYTATRTAIAAVAPTVKIAGPGGAATLNLARFVEDEYRNLSAVSQHFYPLHVCGGTTVTVDQLLSPTTAARSTDLANVAVAASSPRGLPVRLDETNSAACGGQPGVSDSFASALWVTDHVMRTAKAGVAGVNLHGGVAGCYGYTPLCRYGTGSNALRAQPIFYGLLMVHQLGAGRLRDVTITGASDRVTAYAVERADGTVAVLINNMDTRVGGAVSIRLAGHDGPATVTRLEAPTLASTTGVTVGDAKVDVNGNIAPTTEPVTAEATGLTVQVAPSSAAVVTLPA
jgi:hypothetical protein